MKNNQGAVLGIDFGATNLKALLLDKNGNVLSRFQEPSEQHRGPDHTLDRIISLARQAITQARDGGLGIEKIGIGVCGPVECGSGILIESPVLPGWFRVPVGPRLAEGTGLPVSVDNDANAAIMGEWWLGSGERQPVVAGLTLGTGVGGGLIIGGKIYHGGNGFGGEFGHIAVAQEPPCPCGGSGCLGRLASATATLERYKKIAGENAEAALDVEELARLSGAGSEAARLAIAESARYLSKAILILVNCLNPNIFVIAGGMSQLGEALLQPVRDHIARSTFPDLARTTRVEMARLGVYSGCYGAARLAIDNDAHI